MTSDDPLRDWANHVHAMDSKPIEYDHVCDSCQLGFIKGSQFDTEKFCKECMDELKHVEYYEERELTVKDIYEILSTEVKL